MTPVCTIPFTLTMVLLVVGSGILIGASDERTSAAFVAHYGYSLQHIIEGRVWVILTMIPPWADWTSHVPVIISFLLILGTCEWIIGARQTWFVYLAGHTLTMLLVTLLLLAGLYMCGATACGLPVQQLDSGTSVGVICCLGAVLGRWRRVWPLMLAVLLFLIGWLMYFRTLYAVEHLIGYPVGCAIGWKLVATDFQAYNTR